MAVLLRGGTWDGSAHPTMILLFVTGLFAVHTQGNSDHTGTQHAGKALLGNGPTRYEVNRSPLGSLVDRFTIKGRSGEDLGAVSRIFPGWEMQLYGPGGDVQAAVKWSFMSNDLEFFDAKGNPVAKFLGLGWGWFSGPVLCEWLSRDGKLLGVTRRIDISWASAAAVV